jgi:hypothetical protein
MINRSPRFLLAIFLVAWPGSLQGQHAVLERQFPLPLMDIGIVADTLRGVQMAAAPSINSLQGNDKLKVIWLELRPDSLEEWLNVAAAYLETPPRPGEADGIRWAPALPARRSPGRITMGRSVRHNRFTNERYLALSDSQYAWRVPLSADTARQFLSLLLEASSLARLRDPSIDSLQDPMKHCVGPLTKPRVISEPTPIWVGRPGRVILSVVLDSTGAPEMATFVAPLATDSTFREEARRVVSGSRFTPGSCDGHTLEVPVQQVLGWRY